MSEITKHFVTFYSPGTFFAEDTTLPIDSWDVDAAKEMASKVVERYNATPYAFQFSTRTRNDDQLDSVESKRSTTYHLGGSLMDIEAVKQLIPDSSILQSNMRCNGWNQVVLNDNSWRSVQPFKDGDVLLEYTPPVSANK